MLGKLPSQFNTALLASSLAPHGKPCDMQATSVLYVADLLVVLITAASRAEAVGAQL